MAKNMVLTYLHVLDTLVQIRTPWVSWKTWQSNVKIIVVWGVQHAMELITRGFFSGYGSKPCYILLPFGEHENNC